MAWSLYGGQQILYIPNKYEKRQLTLCIIVYSDFLQFSIELWLILSFLSYLLYLDTIFISA
jgi:hypothetical protein